MLKAKKSERTVTPKSIINKGVSVVGTITSCDSILINGNVDGTVKCETSIIVEKSGYIKGSLIAEDIYIDGYVHGNINASNKAVLTETAKIVGDITTENLIVDQGAEFNGICLMPTEENEIKEKEGYFDEEDSSEDMDVKMIDLDKEV